MRINVLTTAEAPRRESHNLSDDNQAALAGAVGASPCPDLQAPAIERNAGAVNVAGVAGGISVIIAEDEDLFRELICSVLSESGKAAVVGAYSDAEAALEAARRLRPKVVVLDIELKGRLNGIQAGLLLRKECPDIGIVWLSSYKRPYLPVSFQQQKTSGWAYLLKQSGTDASALLAAIDAVSKGFVVLDAQISESMNRLVNTWMPALTPSQYDVLALMAQGFGNAAVVKTLDLPEKSVERILNQIYRHLQLDRRGGTKHRRVEAVLCYLRGGRAAAN
jgi:DNA-binding NarL/FixJ family response regulator